LLFRIVSRIGLAAGAFRPRLKATFLLFGHLDLRESTRVSARRKRHAR
jgi:hypothetical protein